MLSRQCRRYCRYRRWCRTILFRRCSSSYIRQAREKVGRHWITCITSSVRHYFGKSWWIVGYSSIVVTVSIFFFHYHYSFRLFFYIIGIRHSSFEIIEVTRTHAEETSKNHLTDIQQRMMSSLKQNGLRSSKYSKQKTNTHDRAHRSLPIGLVQQRRRKIQKFSATISRNIRIVFKCP